MAASFPSLARESLCFAFLHSFRVGSGSERPHKSVILTLSFFHEFCIMLVFHPFSCIFVQCLIMSLILFQSIAI